MAKDKKSGNRVLGLIKSVQSSMDTLYKNTYITQPSNTRDLNTIKNDIDSSIDNIVNNNLNSVGVSNISQLYNRINLKQNMDKEGNAVSDELESLFGNKAISDGILTSFTENKYLKEYDEEIDLICKFMPKLEEALDAKKDNVLAADNFSKDFINVINTSNVNRDVAFNDRIENIKKAYKLPELFEDAYDNTAKYGEQFIYIIPYKKAFDRILNGKNKAVGESNIITENFNYSINESSNEQESNTFDGNIRAELHISGVLESAVRTHRSLKTVLEKTNSFDKTISDNLEFEGISTNGEEGLIDINSAKKKKTKIEVPGCIVKKLKRENVIPIYIEDICLGYYYIECEFDDVFTSKMTDFTSPLKNGKLTMGNEVTQQDNVLRQLSSRLSQFIDSNFVNSNQDLKKEIYMVLKHNQMVNSKDPVQMKITFIPVDDMVHMVFNKDQKTNRGISDLDNALLPAKLYSSLYVTNTIGMITRGHDKRVYYVKNNVDTNISKVLLNTINQIKKSNFGARELTSLKNMLNVQGRFSDFVIPVGSTGDSPINFEIMQGQDIDPKTELLEMLEEMAISSTDVPYEYIQSNKMVDYAVRLTMSNGKFLRKVFKRQAKCELYFSEILTKIYNTEYDENDYLDVMLPPPSYLNITNTNQMLQNVNDYVQQILEMEMAHEEDETLKSVFAKKLKRHYLSTYLDIKAIETIKDQSMMENEQEKKDDNM